MNPLRVFVPGEGRLETVTSSITMRQDMLDVTHASGFSGTIPGLHYFAGEFAIDVAGKGYEKVLSTREAIVRQLYGRIVWIFYQSWNCLFAAVVGSIEEPSINIEQNEIIVNPIRASFRSQGPSIGISPKMQPHLPMIVAFESDMPNSLPMYRDWCEEMGWQGRCEELTRQWAAAQEKTNA